MIPHFTYPWALFLLAFVPWLAWRFARQSRGAWQFSDRRLLPRMKTVRTRLAWWGGLAFRVAGLSAAVLALAGPRWVSESRIETEGIAIAMIVDVSVSMDTEDFDWEGKKLTRLVGVKKLFRLFVAGGTGPGGGELPGRPHDLIALVAFGTHPHAVCPVTLEHAALLQIMEEQKIRTGVNEGTTNPGDAIVLALDALQQAPTKRKVIVLLTDGDANVRKVLKPLQAAQLAANLSIPIYAIDASPAKPKDADEAKESANARDMLQTVARMTQGSYFRAEDGRGLVQAYESIDRLERERILSFQYRRYYEAFQWFALASLLCWGSLVVLEATIWRKVP